MGPPIGVASREWEGVVVEVVSPIQEDAVLVGRSILEP